MFKRKTEPPLPTTPRVYPNGVCVVTPSGRYYINGKFKNPIKSEKAFQSWNFPTIVKTSDEAVSKYLVGLPLGLRPGTFCYDFNSGSYYLIVASQKMKLTNTDSFDLLGLNPRDALWVGEDVMTLHKEGGVI